MPDKGVQVIDRVFDILELVSTESDGIGITEISSRLGLNKSTVHRIVTALSQRGYLEKMPMGTNYGLGLKLVETASLKLNSVELKTEAKPYLLELSNKIKHPAHLAILDGTDAVYIDKVDVITNIRLYSEIGKRIPCYCSGLGKCLLLQHDNKVIESMFKKICFQNFTAKTPNGIERLMQDIELARKKGYATDDEEHEDGIRCVAAPVYDYRHEIIAAISVSGLSNFFSAERDNEIGQVVIETAGQISKRLGYHAL